MNSPIYFNFIANAYEQMSFVIAPPRRSSGHGDVASLFRRKGVCAGFATSDPA
jgi:hypothetical protein